jgi:hypothetical protein
LFYLLFILPFPLLIAASFYLNSKKIFERSGNKYVVSILEGISAYLIISSILLEGFIINPVLQTGIFMLGLIVLYFINNNADEDTPELDTQIETIKNLFIVFSSTVLLFYILLSVFRFQPFYFQIIYALIGVSIFNYLSYFMKRFSSRAYEKFDFTNSKIVNFKAWYIYAILGVLFLSVAFFNIPKVALNTAINLNDSKAYYAYPDGSNNLANRFEQKEIMNINIDQNMVTNPYLNHQGDNLFIYVNNSVSIYNLQSNTIVYQGVIQESVEGIPILQENQETNETSFEPYCSDPSSCTYYDDTYEYGGIEYYSLEPLYRFDDLEYEYSDTAIFSEEILHLFKNEIIDSRLSTINDRPFVGFGYSQVIVSDIDYYDGMIEYLQVERKGESVSVQVIQVIERDIDINLPFYSHYRFGMLVFILIIGFVPLSNYDLFVKVSGFDDEVNQK